ncbi:radical SAM protein [Sphaerisporangium perillae]|uniref:radical SAM protein n=1 Tax=Sphaerisporangium perillae TaxID=2935860 RepID=UPI00200BA7E7|nr:radical SAM protein [Sphaerisporangium perillae]
MTVEVRPLGVKCNLSCTYCYQDPQRAAGNITRHYDLDRMKAGLLAEGRRFSVFGGEPLMLPIDDLTDLLSWGYERFGGSGVQTNGTLLTDEHITLFRRYNVHVGVSIDGPDELNDVRRLGSLTRTRQATERTFSAIHRLCEAGVPPSLIITLHRGNASPDRLPRLIDWVRGLETLGVRHARLHLLETESATIKADLGLSAEENIAALRAFRALEAELTGLRFDLFTDMRDLLQGRDDRTTCVWNGCDPLTTQAVRGVEGNGQRTNCGRTNKEGIDFQKADQPGFERYLALYHTPYEAGGCNGCRFFLMCKGQCPGTAIDQDWRNRTDHCEVWMTLYADLERELTDQGTAVVSRSRERREIEGAMLAAWSNGRQVTMTTLLSRRQTARPWRERMNDLRARVADRT